MCAKICLIILLVVLAPFATIFFACVFHDISYQTRNDESGVVIEAETPTFWDIPNLETRDYHAGFIIYCILVLIVGAIVHYVTKLAKGIFCCFFCCSCCRQRQNVRRNHGIIYTRQNPEEEEELRQIAIER